MNNKNDAFGQLLKVGQQLYEQYQEHQRENLKPEHPPRPADKTLELTTGEVESLKMLISKAQFSALFLTPQDKAVIDKVNKL